MPPRSPARPSVAVIGTGRLARAVVEPLHRAGYPLAAIAGRRRAAVAAVGRGLPVERRTTDLGAACARAQLVLLAVTDDALPGLATTLARESSASWRGRSVLHFAGALGPDVLAPLAACGAAIGVLHPLQCLGTGGLAAELLSGSRARIEGDARGRRAARRLAIDLGMKPLVARRTLRDPDRAAYHAAASLASNDLVALLWDAEQLMVDAGFARRSAREGLVTLVRGTLTQIAERGPGAALSGPVARGDVVTFDRQLRRLARRSPDLAAAHRALGLRLAALARARRASGRSRGRGV